MPKIENPCPQCSKEAEVIQSVEPTQGYYLWCQRCYVSVDNYN